MAAKYPSHDTNTYSFSKDLRICQLYQQDPRLCPSCSCSNLHICRDYLLNSKCSKLNSDGKCSHCHTLFTLHNRLILDNLKSVSQDEQEFDRVAKFIRDSEANSSKTVSNYAGRLSISDNSSKVASTSGQASSSELTSTITSGQDHAKPSFSLYNNQSLQSTLTSLPAYSTASGQSSITKDTKTSILLSPSKSTVPNSSITIKPSTADVSLRPKFEITKNIISLLDNNSKQLTKTNRKLSGTASLATFKSNYDQKLSDDDHSTFFDETDEKSDDNPMLTTTSSRNEKPKRTHFHHSLTLDDKTSSIFNPKDEKKMLSQTKYVFNKYVKDTELSYLLGPGRYLMKNEGCQIFPSGYCLCTNDNEEKKIKENLDKLLHTSLKSDPVPFNNSELTLVIMSPRSPTGQDQPYLLSSDGKLYIQGTNSSISVISADITQVPVDMMVCVHTSLTLLDSVLSQAGSSIASAYSHIQHSTQDIILEGGKTKAQKILFAGWKIEVQGLDTSKVQKSLSNFVKRCIDCAVQQNMRSISFPSVGTGNIGLNPHQVCESMMTAASERLRTCKMDVLFVIYPSTQSNHDRYSYSIFRAYLDNLCQQNGSKNFDTSSATHVSHTRSVAIKRSQNIHRTLTCKHILIVSNLPNIVEHQKLLEKSLKGLIKEYIYDLSLVRRPLVDRIEQLIDICLMYHVLPCIDFSKNKLILHGDRESCLQCFDNLRPDRLIYEYYIYNNGKKFKEIKMNTYESMKIDEALSVGEAKIHIEHDNNTRFDIDLRTSQVQIYGDTKPAQLHRTLLNEDSKIVRPLTWSPTFLKIQMFPVSNHVFNSIECVRMFQQSMPTHEWCIERVDTIQNWPLYVHYAKKQYKHSTLVFYGCPFSSVQSIIHYGLYSNDGKEQSMIRLTSIALNSHIYNARRSTDRKYYMFAVQLSSKKSVDMKLLYLSNEDAHLALPTHLIVYERNEKK
ncbi:unnamed protein product [Rotaria sp. Silwood1]|nr:unnamed protein product [Rotaria sp. Silwood1]CAF1224713.1 unnamed protein product [Rotaria sp. Silwood1]